ncbi:hypothetical protein Patl1_06985 [Pistacia atlantica]|uniref:Uncharacterized protein n=1 Tax=Pistacia atlantica TaxID=434234 RepID=A0ACC1ALB8_9ROSI|nr:hypothetical protein Patl1_06985 [Pistacia atlantica]
MSVHLLYFLICYCPFKKFCSCLLDGLMLNVFKREKRKRPNYPFLKHHQIQTQSFYYYFKNFLLFFLNYRLQRLLINKCITRPRV